MLSRAKSGQFILCNAGEVLPVNIGNILVEKVLPIPLAILFYKSIGNMEAILKKNIANSIAILSVLQY